MRIIGFRHDLKTGGGKAGITFQVMGATPIQHLINPLTPSEYGDDFEVLATGSWSASEMRSWLNGELYAKLPADLTKNIVAVDKKTNSENRYNGADIKTTSDKLWLLSPAEVYGTVPGLTGGQKFSDKEIATYTAEGTQYKLFKDNGITTSADGYGEEPLGYWDITLRSPYSSNQWLEICNISGKGLSLDRTPTSYSGSGDETFHLAPCFCF